MPNIIVPIKAVHESVTRLVGNAVTRQVLKMTGLSQNIPVRFPGDKGVDTQPGSTIDDSPNNLFEHHSRVFITLNEEYKEDAVINSPVRHCDSPPVFYDHALGIVMKPIYSHTGVTINIEYRASTRSEIETWRNDIKVRLADNRAAFLHELDYHYEVPSSCLSILSHIHELREKVAGYGEDMGAWWKRCFTERASTLTNQNGTGSLFVIGERSVGVQGWFEFTEPTNAEKDSEGASWTISFTYRFNYQKPVSMHFVYPLMVHNQLIHRDLFSKEPPYSLDDRYRLPTESRSNFDSVIGMYRKPYDPMGGIRHPVWDEWIPDIVPPYTTSLASWLIAVDQTDPTLVVDMNDLGDEEITDYFRNFLMEHYMNVTKRGKALITFTLFAGKTPMPDATLVMGPDLKIRSTTPLDMRTTYHLRLSAITELSVMDATAIEGIRTHGCFALLIWQSIIPNLDVEYIMSKMPVDCFMTSTWYEWFYQYIRDLGIGVPSNDSYISPHNPNYRSYYIEWPLVSYLNIIAKRRN